MATLPKPKSVTVGVPVSFSDFDFNFKPHPVTGDLVIRHDLEAVRKSVKHLVLTYFYERPFQPALGCRVPKLLFDLLDKSLESSLKESILEVLQNYEPRAQVLDIICNFKHDANGVDVVIFFNVTNIGQATVSIFLKRVR